LQRIGDSQTPKRGDDGTFIGYPGKERVAGRAMLVGIAQLSVTEASMTQINDDLR
jgi:hypothetical protein